VKRTAADQYAFDFTDVRRWVRLALKHGANHLEFTHFFTPAPTSGKHPQRIFERGEDKIGPMLWPTEVGATSDAYRKFLEQFLPQFKQFLEEEKVLGRLPGTGRAPGFDPVGGLRREPPRLRAAADRRREGGRPAAGGAEGLRELPQERGLADGGAGRAAPSGLRHHSAEHPGTLVLDRPEQRSGKREGTRHDVRR
jgi:hypothetical protein